MTGLDRIEEKILEEARMEADAILEKARTEADGIRQEVREETDREVELRKDRAGSEQRIRENRIQSACDRIRRRILLEARLGVIGDILEKSLNTIRQADPEGYFQALEKLLVQNIRPESGTMYLAAKDLESMPETFGDRVAAIAQKAGGTLEIAKTPGSIPDGFVLVYGGIEMNCTLRALFDERRERMQDAVNEILWRDTHG